MSKPCTAKGCIHFAAQGYKRCQMHIDADRAHKKRCKAKGLCSSCKVRPHEPHKKSCAECLRKISEQEPRRLETHRLRKFGVSPEDMRAMVEAQKGCCAICGVYMNSPCVDHDHNLVDEGVYKRHTVRGLLCHTCNSGIGMLQDSVRHLEAAIRYLQNPPAKQVLQTQAV